MKTGTFLIFILFMLGLPESTMAQKLNLRIEDDGVLFMEGDDSILFYQSAPKSLDGAYERANYIHPLYSLDGEVLTEDFPEDHLHHRGIFWAWHQLYIGGKRIGDGWEIKDFLWQVVSVEEIDPAGESVGITTELIWKSPLHLDIDGNEKALVSEHTTIKVYPAEKNYRQLDIEISLLAMEADMRLGGSENEKGYGGFSARIRAGEGLEFTDSKGKVEPHINPVEAGAWMDFSGSIGSGGSLAGITILSHPENPGYPNPWILRRKNSMQNAVYPYPGASTVPLSESTPTLLRYRILVHQGDAGEINISRIHKRYRKLQP